jgi:plasmid stabilization system protein ParE
MESCSLIEVVALLRKHSELELQILNGRGAAVATERELEATVRRLAAHPHALSAALQTARALRRTPDAVTAREVADWGCSD